MKIRIALIMIVASLFMARLTVLTRAQARPDAGTTLYVPFVHGWGGELVATPSSTATSTPAVMTTATFTPTLLPTLAPTSTPTVIVEVTFTATPTPTVPATPTSTRMPTALPSATMTSTSAATVMPIPTFTATPTPTSPSNSPGPEWRYLGPASGVRALAAAGDTLFGATTDNRLLAREITPMNVSWTDVGHAYNVVAMTGSGERLYGLTADQIIWQRAPVLYDVAWDQVGEAENVTAFAISNPVTDHSGGPIVFSASRAFFATTATDRLLFSGIVDDALGWTDISHAYAVTAVAGATNSLLAADAGGVLWQRSTETQHAESWVSVGAAVNVLDMTVVNNRLLAVTSGGELWERDLPAMDPGAGYCDTLQGPIYGVYQLESGCRYYVPGSIVVQQGARLDVPAGVLLEFDIYRYLAVEGTIIANGTAENPIRFTAFSNSATKSLMRFADVPMLANGLWWAGVGISQSSGATSWLEYVQIDSAIASSYADFYTPIGAALAVNAQPHLAEITLQENCPALHLTGTPSEPALFRNSVIRDSGCDVAWVKDARIENSLITGNDQWVRFHKCTVIAGDNARLINNRFVENYVPAVCVLDEYLSQYGRVFIEHNDFEGNHGAIYVSRPDTYAGLVNVFLNNFDGNGGTSRFHPIYLGTPAAITFACSNARLVNNNMRANWAEYDVAAPCALPASNNWWGTTDTATIASRILGDMVEYVPFAEAPIPDAGAP